VSWERIVLEELRRAGTLPERIDALFEEQRRRWPSLREGEQSLSSLRTRELRDGESRVVVQANPGRRSSTQARVDPASVAERPCFLCPQHMPAEERGVDFGELVLLPNPHPILPRHLTVPGRTHSPQRLLGHLGAMLSLAEALGPELLVFYNGPRCGASAPDHFHFQVCQAAPVPILAELPLAARDSARAAFSSFGRRVIAASDSQATDAAEHLRRVLLELADLAPAPDEPMLNLLLTHRDGRFVSVLFPRRAHRPRRFFDAGDRRLSISPAALEMAGVLVVAEPAHFERVDAAVAREIYQEVSLDAELFSKLAEALT
jgi:ATP adenylyltransferase/5',5'''-P-1,P-4-tetraphosphate phosphorylase II